jgi:hypothetical protein|tara:strand:+ start:463 stop:1506 length:1044 start_codon:yes stop_codon:yes gene_type:complete
MGNAMRVPTHTANDNRRQQAQHFAPHIPGVYEPAKDGLARRERGRKKDATKTVLEQEAERRKHRRSTDDVWLADDDDSAKNVDVEGSFSGAQLHVSEEHQECSVCFEPLCKERTAVFVNEEGVRTCGHFLHERCARSVVEASGCCPICRTECAEARGVPFPTEDADEWFRLCDVEEKGELGEEHVLAVIRAQIPVDWKRLARDLHGLMPRWDKDGSGALTKDALVGEKGLLEYVSATYPARLRCYKHVPHVTEKREWFKFWDEDDSGTLEKDEVVRALIKSFNIQDDVAHIQDVRSVVENIWCVFDTSNSGGIDLTEFLVKDGLGDSIMAAFAVDKRAEMEQKKQNK